MSSLSRPQVGAATQLLMRILEPPGLVAAVRDLPGAVLGKLIDRIGLEDAGELVALASTAQIERIFDAGKTAGLERPVRLSAFNL